MTNTQAKHEKRRRRQAARVSERPERLNYVCLCWKRREKRTGGQDIPGWAGHSPDCWQCRLPTTHSDLLHYDSPPTGGEGVIHDSPLSTTPDLAQVSWWNDEHNYFPQQWWEESALPQLMNKLYKELGLDAYDKCLNAAIAGEHTTLATNPNQPTDHWLEQFGGPTWPTTFAVIRAAAIDSMREYAMRVRSGAYLTGFDPAKVRDGRSERSAHQARAYSVMAGPSLWRFLKLRRAQAWMLPEANYVESERVSQALGHASGEYEVQGADGEGVTMTIPPFSENAGRHNGRASFEYDLGDDNPVAWMLRSSHPHVVQPHDEDHARLRRKARKSPKRGWPEWDREKQLLAQYVVTYWYDTYLTDQQRLAFDLLHGNPHDPRATQRKWKPKVDRARAAIYEAFGYKKQYAREDRREMEVAFGLLMRDFEKRFANEADLNEARERTWTDEMFREQAKLFVDDVMVGPEYPWRLDGPVTSTWHTETGVEQQYKGKRLEALIDAMVDDGYEREPLERAAEAFYRALSRDTPEGAVEEADNFLRKHPDDVEYLATMRAYREGVARLRREVTQELAEHGRLLTAEERKAAS